jgi:hypothetical protein
MKTSVFLAALVLLPPITPSAAFAQIYVSSLSYGVGVYNFDGSPINRALIDSFTTGIAIAGQRLFVSDFLNDRVSEYSLDGTMINESFIEIRKPTGIAVSGSEIYVANFDEGIIGKYSLDGSPIDPFLIEGLKNPSSLAVSGTNLYLWDGRTYSVAKYTTSGATINKKLIYLASGGAGMAATDSYLYVENVPGIGQYAPDGTPVNESLISKNGTLFQGLALVDSRLYVIDIAGERVGLYDVDGTILNPSLMTVPRFATYIAVVPEPSTFALLAFGGLGICLHRARRRVN